MQQSGGIGFLGILQIVFIVLKLTEEVDWSWWWVLSPSIFGAIVVLILLLGGVVFAYRHIKNVEKRQYEMRQHMRRR